MAKPISDDLLKILACPACRAKVKLSNDKKHLVCSTCKAVYEIKDGIPVMIVKEK